MAAIAAADTNVKAETTRQVTVYLQTYPEVPEVVTLRAERQASEMFASIGVTLHWRFGRPPKSQTDAIAIEVTTSTPRAHPTDVLARAFPYEGVHIQIFWDRIQHDPFALDPTIHAFLAHVMVHEIACAMRGSCAEGRTRYSEPRPRRHGRARIGASSG